MIKTGEEKANPPLFLHPYAIRNYMQGWIDRDLLEKVWEQDPSIFGPPPPPDMYNYEDVP
jgi:hypothetical protein